MLSTTLSFTSDQLETATQFVKRFMSVADQDSPVVQETVQPTSFGQLIRLVGPCDFMYIGESRDMVHVYVVYDHTTQDIVEEFRNRNQ